MRRIRILVADHQTLLRQLLCLYLAQQPDFDVIGQATNGQEAVEFARELRPDVLVMKLLMPVVSGAQATEQILAVQPRTRVVLLTDLDGLQSVAELAGASGCVQINTSGPETVAQAIRQASQAEATRRAQPSLDMQDAAERVAGRASLTLREAAVLKEAVCTDATVHGIARTLSASLGEDVTAASVRHTLDRIMTKLQLEPRTRVALVKYILDAGQRTAGGRL